MFGGLSKPVNQGETDLNNNPLGDKRKIKPKHKTINFKNSDLSEVIFTKKI